MCLISGLTHQSPLTKVIICKPTTITNVTPFQSASRISPQKNKFAAFPNRPVLESKQFGKLIFSASCTSFHLRALYIYVAR